MAKETYEYSKRGLQKSSKRGLLIQQKRPTNAAKEPYKHSKRALKEAY